MVRTWLAPGATEEGMVHGDGPAAVIAFVTTDRLNAPTPKMEQWGNVLCFWFFLIGTKLWMG
jgi:hypothetical protein